MMSRSDDVVSTSDGPAVHAVRLDSTEDCAASDAVVTTVANVRGEDPTVLDPLHDSIDPDALDALFAGREPDSRDYVEFAYAGYDVTVSGDGRIVVAETE